MNPINMNPMMASPGSFGQDAGGTNLLSIFINLSGYGQQMAAFGFATTAAPYVVLAPIVGMVLRQLASVRSLKSFAFFAVAVIVGFAVSYFSYGYIAALLATS